MARPVAGKLGYDSGTDRPTVSLASGVEQLVIEGDASTALDTTGAAVVVSGSAPPTTGQVLVATSATAATWQPAKASVRARVYASAGSTTGAGWQKIPYDTVVYDPSSIWSAANTNFLPTLAGYYQVTLRARLNAANVNTLGIGQNGAQSFGVGHDSPAGLLAISGTGMAYCNGTTDTIDGRCYCTIVTAYTTGNFDTWMEILGPY